MNNPGYTSVVQKGSIENGFSAAELSNEFAQHLDKVEPLPNGCAF